MRIGFLGAGNMATAIISGLLSSRLVTVDQVRIYDPSEERRRILKEEHGVSALSTGAELASWCSTLVLAVKPQVAETALKSCAAALSGGSLVLSVAAGMQGGAIAELVGGRVRIVRAMPNTPALVGAGVTALCLGPGAEPSDLELAQRIFQAVGSSVVVSEGQMDAVTGLSGSGPAYALTILEALADAGVREGLPRSVAEQLALGTLEGTCKMLRHTKEHPAVLRAQVTSPGGTTAAGLNALEAGGLRYTLGSAVSAAAARSRELGSQPTKSPSR